MDKVRNATHRLNLKPKSIVEQVEEKQLRWYKHINRMKKDKIIRKTVGQIVTDEDSGEEDNVVIQNLPGAQLRADAEDYTSSDEESNGYESEDNLPLSNFVTRSCKWEKNSTTVSKSLWCPILGAMDVNNTLELQILNGNNQTRLDSYKGKSNTIAVEYKDLGLGASVVLWYTNILLDIVQKVLFVF
ncbi:hypothetical protein ILUMI_19353 [Ignelater luminosus]|uniref:Uncharacterized protein n=1 Tax=Ignelater luminosus TaxID=2038154 RepID=A0A8K0CGF3_IGNLU|nr:hypothetical protein ILUMI_19353 [Ignelater luminosus]